MKTFRFDSWGRIIVIGICMPGMAALTTKLYFLMLDPSVLMLPIAIAIGAIILLMRGLRKIVVSDEGVKFIGVKHRYFISWNEVKSMGVFKSTKSGTYKLANHDVKKISRGQDFIYVSTESDPKLSSPIKSNFIFLEYRKSAYDFISELYEKNKLLSSTLALLLLM